MHSNGWCWFTVHLQVKAATWATSCTWTISTTCSIWLPKSDQPLAGECLAGSSGMSKQTGFSVLSGCHVPKKSRVPNWPSKCSGAFDCVVSSTHSVSVCTVYSNRAGKWLRHTWSKCLSRNSQPFLLDFCCHRHTCMRIKIGFYFQFVWRKQAYCYVMALIFCIKL